MLCQAFPPLTGLAYYFSGKGGNSFIRFLAAQSIIVYGSLILIWAILHYTTGINEAKHTLVFVFVGSSLWGALMWSAYQGRWLKLRLVGRLAERLSNSAAIEDLIGNVVIFGGMGSVGKEEVFDSYHAKVTDRLQKERYGLISGVQFGGYTFTYVGKRMGFEITKTGLVETSIIFAEFDGIDAKTLWDYSKACHEYALKTKKVRIPWGPLHYSICYCVALVYGVSSAVSDEIEDTTPEYYWKGYGVPLLYDLATSTVHYGRDAVNEWLARLGPGLWRA